MGLGLGQSRPPGQRHDDALKGVRVHDAFDLKASYGLNHDPGVVLVLDSFVVEAPRSLIGKHLRVRPPTGSDRCVTVDDVKDHGTTISLFIKNLTSRDVPIGSILDLESAD